MGKKDKFDTELHKKAVILYEQLRPEIETDENIGQMIVMDVVSGDYEIGVLGIEASYRLQKRCNSYYKRGWIRTSSKEVYLFATQISFCIAKICSDVQRPSCG